MTFENDRRVSRRRFHSLAGGGLLSLVFGQACRVESRTAEASAGRLAARPRADATPKGPTPRTLGLGDRRDAIVQLPSTAAATPVPLLVLLHGAGGSGEGILRRLGSAAEEAGVAVLAPDSRESTWDAIRGGFGPDVAFIDRALARVFETTAVDPARVTVGGFSDGATYALSLGLINGDLFRRIVAFSPGFIADGAPSGTPKVFISHGTDDPILPIDRCSHVIVPALRRRGYDVTFREFNGRHEIPAEIALDGMKWAAAV
jgi:phospholipase/carboxylesterase